MPEVEYCIITYQIVPGVDIKCAMIVAAWLHYKIDLNRAMINEKFAILVLVQYIIHVCNCADVGKIGVSNNVCKTLQDYTHIQNNKNCWYNPDVHSTPSQIAKRHGYPFEKHRVITDDGYILTVFRVPHNNVEIDKKRRPILLQHGIGITSITWMLNGKDSPAFLLAENGYDVWLPNLRGTTYSTGHQKYTIDQKEYWDFSFHEMALHDWPAIIDYIGTKTNQPGELIIVGHSMGTTISYVYSILRKEHAEKNVRGFVSVAPVAYMKNIRALVKYVVPFSNLIRGVLASMDIYAIGQFPQLQRMLIEPMCGTYPGIQQCEIIHGIISGIDMQQIAPENFPGFVYNYPTGTSIKCLLHFSQIIQSNGRFPLFDYGPQTNLVLYNSTIPPEYDLEAISRPVHLIYGSKDFLAEEENVKRLYQKLKTEKSITKLSKGDVNFAHNDFFLGRYAYVFRNTLLELLTQKFP